MSDWLEQIALKARSRTGLGAGLVACFLVAALSLVIAVGFLCASAFMWLASRYDTVTAGLILSGVFLLIALLALVAGYFARRRNMERARLELAVRNQPAWLDPKLLTLGLEIGRAVGWRRIAVLAVAGFIAAGLGRERSTGQKPEPRDPGGSS